eukprot:TRINITY_DN2966_c0_g1_i10.p1 TRINITY_DN2966_c0_g1~~TRINITY_DN2966_c0_g1_i10.p1  ORF type:complete len:105 (-),score=12.23 TRINITY_DN2966_c0_g1_i10:181-495(-)
MKNHDVLFDRQAKQIHFVEANCTPAYNLSLFTALQNAANAPSEASIVAVSNQDNSSLRSVLNGVFWTFLILTLILTGLVVGYKYQKRRRAQGEKGCKTMLKSEV